MPTTDGLASWLRLGQIKGVGPATARKLLSAFGLPENIFSASYASLQSVVSENITRAILTPASEEELRNIALTTEWASQPENTILTLADSVYPSALLDIPDPPLLLYIKGNAALLNAPSLAIVGSRNATTQGLRNAENFSYALSETGLTIVSGLALGIDTAAHRGGLRAQGSSIAVIGTGADVVYPARNHALAHEIAERGCLVSEYPLGTPAMAANFPRRNRIISGLSRGVLVIEATAQSGSLITARMAGEQGRDVFAIPGSIHSPLSKGCHQLIKQGAKLVESAHDVLEEIRWDKPINSTGSTAAPPREPEGTNVLLAALEFEPVSTDSLCEKTGLSAAELSSQLLTLEMDGHIERLPNGLYQRLGMT